MTCTVVPKHTTRASDPPCHRYRTPFLCEVAHCLQDAWHVSSDTVSRQEAGGHHTMVPRLVTVIDTIQVLREAQGAVGCCDHTHQDPLHQESVGFVLSSQLQGPLATG